MHRTAGYYVWKAHLDQEDLTTEVNRSFFSFGQKQEQSGRLAHNPLCPGVWDCSSKFTQSASDWQAAEEGEVTVWGETEHTHPRWGAKVIGRVEEETEGGKKEEEDEDKRRLLNAAHQRV